MRFTILRSRDSDASPKTKTAASAQGRRGSRRRHLGLESLETRALLSTVTSYWTPLAANGKSAQPSEITVAGGKIWFTEQAANAVGMIDPANPGAGVQVFSQNSLTKPLGITTGTDGNVWFTETVTSKIGKIDPNNPGTIVDYALPSGTFPVRPISITAAANNSLWYTDPNNNSIGRLDTANPSSPPAPIPIPVGSGLIGITSLNSQIVSTVDGRLWFTEASFDGTGKVTSSGVGIYNPSSGTWSQALLPNPAGKLPSGITVGSDGNVWMTSYTSGTSAELAMINSTTGIVTEYPLSTPPGGSVPLPFRITSGPDGNILYSDAANGLIGSFRLSDKTFLPTQALPTTSVKPNGTTVANPTPNPNGLIKGPDGNIWYADGSGAVGRVSVPTQLAVYNQAPWQVPTSLKPGDSFTIVGYAATSAGWLDGTYTGNLTISVASGPAGASLGGTTTLAASGGVVGFGGLSLNTPGTYTLQITGAGLTTAYTGTIIVQEAASQVVIFNQAPYQIPSSLTSGTSFTVVAYAATSAGALASGYSGPVTISLGNNPGGAIGGTTTVMANGGVAVFSGLTLSGAAGSYTLQITSAGLSTAVSTPITLIQNPPPQVLAASRVMTQPKRGRPTLAGFQFAYNTAMNPATAGSPANYSVGAWVQVTQRVGRRTIRVLKLQTVAASVVFDPVSNTVKLLTGRQTFKRGGQITLSGGISSASNAFLISRVFKISNNAGGIA